jgi:hypothetical protein
LFVGVSTAQTTDDVTVANNTKPLSNEIGARLGKSEAQNSSPLTNKGTVHVLFGLDTPESGVFPTDIFTVADDAQKTGLRIKLPLPDCAVHVSDCRDLMLINVLDGFNLQPRVTIPFDGDIDSNSVNSKNAFFVELGDADVDATATQRETRNPRVIGVNQLIWDPATRVLAIESDEQLRQHSRYAFVITTGICDTSGSPVRLAEELTRFLHDLNNGQTSGLQAYREKLLDGLTALRRLGVSEEQVAGLSVFTTQSATAVVEHIRDKLKAATPDRANFLLGPGGSRTVFPLNSIQDIDWQQQIRMSPPGFQSFKPQFPGETKPFLLLDQYKSGAVGRIAYGSFTSPRYITDEPVMPPGGNRAGDPPVQRVETLYVNVFLPGGTSPPKGWPVVIFGLGISILVWGKSTLFPLLLAATRPPQWSIYDGLTSPQSPLRLFWNTPYLDSLERLEKPLLITAGLSIFLWCILLRTGPALSAALAVLVTLLFYRVGLINYQMVFFLLMSYWVVSEWKKLIEHSALLALLVLYFVVLALLNLINWPGFTEDLLLSSLAIFKFLLGCTLLVVLAHFSASRRGSSPRAAG